MGKVFHHLTRVLQYSFELRSTIIEQQEHGHPYVAAWVSEHDPFSRKSRILSYPDLQVIVEVRIIDPLSSEDPLLLLHIPDGGGKDIGKSFYTSTMGVIAVGVDVRKTQVIKRRR